MILDENIKLSNNIPGIYICTCITTNKSYIGQTKNLKYRIMSEHIQKLNKNKHPNKYLQNSWNKYGDNNFEWKILEICNIEDLDELEMMWISKLNTIYPNGFNLTNGADSSTRGNIMSEVSRKKMSSLWDEKRRLNRSKENYKFWSSLTDSEYAENSRKLKNAWTIERKKKASKIMSDRFQNMSQEDKIEFSKKISLSHKNRDITGANNSNAKAIICTETNEIFYTIKDAAKRYSINYSSLKAHLRRNNDSKIYNKYSFKYIDK